MVKARENIFKRYDYIDSLRGFAIILVLLAHAAIGGTAHYPSWLYKITAIYVGPRGVQLFFVVSAFTLYLSWNNRKDKEKNPLRNFYIRRFFRIAPLFYIAILYFLFIQHYWLGNTNHITLANIFSTVFFVNGAIPAWINNIVYGGWSIAVEMMFYVSFPFIVSKIFSIRTSLTVTFFAMILAQVLRLELNSSIPTLANNYSTYTFEFFPSQLPVFLVGITVFLILKNRWKQKDKTFLLLSSVLFIVLLIVQTFTKLPIIAGHYLYAIFFGGFLYFLSKKPLRLFVNPVTMHLGKVSYSIYLCHVAVLYMLEQYHLIDFFPQYPLLNFFLRFLLLLLCSIAIATLLFHIVEKPGQTLGKKIINHFEKTPKDEIKVALETW